MRLVVLESPYTGDVYRNTRYAGECILDCLRRGESPIASHMLFPQVLCDSIPEERALGMKAGHAWISVCAAVVVYDDYGISPGMRFGIYEANRHNKQIEYRRLRGV